MLNNLDNWLFRGGDDNKECEPSIEPNENISCKYCPNVDCEYWSEFNDYTLQKM